MEKYDPKWARDYLAASEKAFDKLPFYKAEWPPGFQEACEKYANFGFDSIRDIWEGLSNWREYEEGSPDSEREAVAELHAQILEAVRKNDVPFLKKLIKAMELPDSPRQLELNGIRAAIRAFEELFPGNHLRSRDEWPNKQEVRRRAEQILKGAGRPLPVERHWPRIFKKAGLSGLLSVTYGPVRRAKK